MAQALVEAEQGDPWNVYQQLSVLGFLDLSVGSATEAVQSLSRAYEIYEASGARRHAGRLRELLGGARPYRRHRYGEAGRRGVRAASTEGREGDHPCSRASLSRPRPRGAGEARRVACVARGSARPARARRHAVQPRPNASRSRAGVAPPRRATSSPGSLEQARSTFEELGAPLWAERAREELARIPIKRASGSALTPAESRVAELVVDGKTNNEVAQALFVSEKTVEANLTRIYRKLDVRSRSALAARMREPGS